MNITGETQGDILALTLHDARLDAAGALIFKERMRGMIAGHGGRVVLDMRRVEFLDSSGLGALVAVMKLLGGDRRLELAGCGTVVTKVLRLTRLDAVFVLLAGMPDAGTPAGRDAA